MGCDIHSALIKSLDSDCGFCDGIVFERRRIVSITDEFLGGHLRVCNYKTVTDKDCDVCFWAKDVLSKIKGRDI